MRKNGYIAIQRNYSKGKIAGYCIQDIKTGAIKDIGANELKEMIKANKIEVANLKLTTDNRLILVSDDKIKDMTEFIADLDGVDDNEQKLYKLNTDELMKMALSNIDKKFSVFKLKEFNKDKNTFIIEIIMPAVFAGIRDMKAQFLFKYAIDVEEEIVITVPIALRFNGVTHMIRGVDKKDCYSVYSWNKILKNKHYYSNELEIYKKLEFKTLQEKLVEIMVKSLDKSITYDITSVAELEKVMADKSIDELMGVCYSLSGASKEKDKIDSIVKEATYVYALLFVLLSIVINPAISVLLSSMYGTLINIIMIKYKQSFG